MPSSIFSCQQGNAPINKISSICACVYLYTVYKLLICKSVPLWVNKRTFTNPCPQSEHYNKLCYGSYVWPVHIKVTVPTSEHANNKLAAKNPKTKPKETLFTALFDESTRKHQFIFVFVQRVHALWESWSVWQYAPGYVCMCVHVCACVCVRVKESEWERVREGCLFLQRSAGSPAMKDTEQRSREENISENKWSLTHIKLLSNKCFQQGKKQQQKTPKNSAMPQSRSHCARTPLPRSASGLSLTLPTFHQSMFFSLVHMIVFLLRKPAPQIPFGLQKRKKEKKTLLFLNCCCNSVIAPLWQE